MNRPSKAIFLSIIIVLIFQSIALLANKQVTSIKGRWLQVKIEVIGAASDDILETALKKATSQGYDGLLIKLDTPGGSLDSTRSMVQNIMSSDIPIVVWVGPSGSRAGSAGAFITLSAHVAAMAPGSNIGAAHPVQATGKDVEGEMSKKVENDTVAFIESIAETRGRNVELARSFVILSTSITAQEAKEQNIIDLIAPSPIELLRSIDGREIILDGGNKIILATTSATIDIYENSLQQELLSVLSNPNLFYLLFLAGIIGLGFELTHPGVMFPGVIGAICLVLALIATSVLPVSFGAMILTLAGVSFMVAEMFVPSFGILGIGGFAAFCIGSFLLVDPGNEQGLRISIWTILPGALVIASTALGIGYLLIKSERQKIVSGSETMIGQYAKAVEHFENRLGKVVYEGEIWQAELAEESAAECQEGQILEILNRNGLILKVRSKV